MQIDLFSLAPREAHDLLTSAIIPRPIAWVSSVSRQGIINLAPFSFFSGVTWHPPTLSISVVNREDGSRKDTVLNIEETGCFVVNMVSEAMGPRMVATAVKVPRDVDEALMAGVALTPSAKVDAPRVRDARIAFECRMAHPFHFAVTAQVLGHGQSVFGMPFHTQRQGFDTLQRGPGVVR